jgi:hypothetical protein
VREVGANDFRMTVKQQPFYLDHRLLGIALAAVRILFWWRVGFEYRCRHADPIAQGRGLSFPLALGINTLLMGSSR